VGIIGSSVFEHERDRNVNVTAICYMHVLETFLYAEIRGLAMMFQQDGATSHTATISMEKLCNMFPHCLISWFGNLTWPPRSPYIYIYLPPVSSCRDT
jgi:hypothetical protein